MLIWRVGKIGMCSASVSRERSHKGVQVLEWQLVQTCTSRLQSDKRLAAA